jgi:hypothetical protein
MVIYPFLNGTGFTGGGKTLGLERYGLHRLRENSIQRRSVMKGTGFSPYINPANLWALAPEGMLG